MRSFIRIIALVLAFANLISFSATLGAAVVGSDTFTSLTAQNVSDTATQESASEMRSTAIKDVKQLAAVQDPDIKTLYDISITTPTVLGTPADMTLTQKTATNGVIYYNFAFEEGWSVEQGGYSSTPYLQLPIAKHYLKDGWRSGDTSEGSDDTDYLVIDLDISTDTNRFDCTFFQTLFYYGNKTEQADGSYKGVRSSAQAGHYAIYGDSTDDVFFTASTAPSVVLPVAVAGYNEWAHITMVVDATTDTNRTAHLYYNGHFVNSRVCMTDSATFLESIRIILGSNGVAPDLDNESLAIANVTVRAFPVDYDGELAQESSNLGNALYPLSSFSDLEYCLADLPENTIAEVTHADSTVSMVTRISDLDGNLVAGDRVKLYADVSRKIVVPGVVENGELIPAVSFELNGHSMVPPLPLADYESFDWIVRDEAGELWSCEAGGAALVGAGTQTYTDGELTCDNLYAFLQVAFPSGISGGNNVKITFLKDTSISYTASMKHGNCFVTYDLNGNTLTLAGGSTPFQSAAATAKLLITDGRMVNNISSPLYIAQAARYYVAGVDMILNSAFCDQRAGILFFLDSKITSTATITSIKSYSRNSAYALFEGCELSVSGVSPISFSNLRTGGARRGSMNNFVGMYDSAVSGDVSLISVNYFANEWTGADEAALSNRNDVAISIQSSSISITGKAPVIASEIHSLTDLNYAFAEGFSAITSLYFDNLGVDAGAIASSVEDSAKAKIAANDVTVGAYSAEMYLVIKRSNLKTGNYMFSNTVGSGSDNGFIDVKLHDGVMLSCILWATDDGSTVNVGYAEGVKLAYSYDKDYPYVATLNWTESTLVGDRPQVTTVKMSSVFTEGMVLQAQKDINIYGTCATVGANIEVTLGQSSATTTVAGDGSWRVTLPPMDYAKGLTLSVNEIGVAIPETRIENVNIGEVWIIAGQSNAVYGVYKMEDFEEYRKNANNFDNIYAFAVSQSQSLVENDEAANSGWYNVNSATLTKDDRYGGISAIAYVMATRLATVLGRDVTIGILDINFNGSTVEAWMSPENLSKVDPTLDAKYTAYRDFYETNGTYPTADDVSEYGTYVASGKLYQKMACSCYNAMIAPFFDGYSIRGAIWDQGGGNAAGVSANSDGDYEKHFTGVRNTFREVFADEELPMFMIQLSARMSDPFYFRALQSSIASKDANTYVVAAPTAGSTYSANELKYTNPVSDSMVHYERKSPVGLALADSVLENVYGKGALSAPKILSIEKRDNAIIITFDREITIDIGTEMFGFDIAGADVEWKAAEAVYKGSTVTLTADGVSNPDRVRYGCGKCILTLNNGAEIIHCKEDATFAYDEDTGIVTITANGNVYEIDTSDPCVVGSRLQGNLVATNGTALPVFLAIVE